MQFWTYKGLITGKLAHLKSAEIIQVQQELRRHLAETVTLWKKRSVFRLSIRNLFSLFSKHWSSHVHAGRIPT